LDFDYTRLLGLLLTPGASWLGRLLATRRAGGSASSGKLYHASRLTLGHGEYQLFALVAVLFEQDVIGGDLYELLAGDFGTDCVGLCVVGGSSDEGHVAHDPEELLRGRLTGRGPQNSFVGDGLIVFEGLCVFPVGGFRLAGSQRVDEAFSEARGETVPDSLENKKQYEESRAHEEKLVGAEVTHLGKSLLWLIVHSYLALDS
jgi:hypothetical protein